MNIVGANNEILTELNFSAITSFRRCITAVDRFIRHKSDEVIKLRVRRFLPNFFVFELILRQNGTLFFAKEISSILNQ